MVINRNSLQAAGAGRIRAYCLTKQSYKAIAIRLASGWAGWLKALTEEQRSGRLSITACQAWRNVHARKSAQRCW
ncbi:MAG: hypothetical protein U0074_08495 [Kouleothrix sp.]